MNTPQTSRAAHLAELVRKAKEAHEARLQQRAVPGQQIKSPSSTQKLEAFTVKPTLLTAHSTHVLSNSVPSVTGIPLNERQQDAVELAMRGKSFCLCGAAGTGKTTTTREVVGQLVRMSHIHPMKDSTKKLSAGDPGIAIVSFTNKAVNNIKRQLPDALKHHCMTIHKLLEYMPVKSFDPMELDDLGWRTIGADGKPKYAGMFLPSRNRINKLPHISCIIVEESSMVDTPLFQNVLNALPDPQLTQFIFLGDLNQLPPIFGDSILGHQLTELPVVELTHVYRQALQSPIISLAHRVREGLGFTGRLESTFTDDRGENGKVIIRPWVKKIDPTPAAKVMLTNLLIPIVDSPTYDPNTTQILCPFNKQLGTIALNQGIAFHLSKKRGALTHEVIARYSRTYWAVGDRVLYDKQDAVIVSIEESPSYDGVLYQEPSVFLDRTGRRTDLNAEPESTATNSDSESEESPDDVLDRLYSSDLKMTEGETQNEASHIIKVEMVDTGDVIELSSAGEINSMLLSYVITVHKSQGSEWDRVFIILHYSHNTMLSRELLYTAITRAKKELFIVAEPDRGTKGEHRPNSITRAAKAPEILGVSLKEKAEYFRRRKGESSTQQSLPNT